MARAGCGRRRRPAGDLTDAPAARHQHLLRGQALAAARGLGAGGPGPARAAARAAQPRPGRPAAIRSAGPTPASCERRRRPRPRAPLHVHRPRRLLGEPAAGARCGRSRGGARVVPAGHRLHRRVGGRATGGHVGCFSVPDWHDPVRRAELWAGLAGALADSRRMPVAGPRVPRRREPGRRAGAIDAWR